MLASLFKYFCSTFLKTIVHCNLNLTATSLFSVTLTAAILHILTEALHCNVSNDTKEQFYRRRILEYLASGLHESRTPNSVAMVKQQLALGTEPSFPFVKEL